MQQLLDQFVGQFGRRQVARKAGGKPFAVLLLGHKRSKLADAYLGVQIVECHARRRAWVDVCLARFDLALQPFFTEEKLAQVNQIVGGPVGNVIQLLLHTGSKLEIHQLLKVLFHQLGDGKGGKGRHQLLALFETVAALLDRVDDRGIGAGRPMPSASNALTNVASV